MKKNYYEILGINGNATETEIKKAYRILSKKYHPDTNAGDNQAMEKFQEISEAYSILGNAEKRKAYDEQLKPLRQETKQKKQGTQGNAGSKPFHYHDMSEQFEQFFGVYPEQNKRTGNQSGENRKTNANPADVSDLFYKYMGFKK